jgi:single-strand DNA-binding protein
MNQVALVGNITDDPELRYTQSGAALASFTVAVSHRFKHNGDRQDVNEGFFRCTAWRSVAENASRTLRKAWGSSTCPIKISDTCRVADGGPML